MRRFVAAFLGLLVVPLALCRCAHLWQVAATEDVPGQPPSADNLDVGHVAFVRGAESWVLISLDKGVQLPTGALLQAKSTVNSEELAQLKLTQQKSTGYQAASILSGAPRYGDAVIMIYPKGDGSDPEDQIQLDDIPPLLKRRAPDPATLTSQDGNSASSDLDPIPLPPEEDFLQPDSPSVLVEQPLQIRTSGIEPRSPTNGSDPLLLPDWSRPDDSETFLQELPQR